MSTHGHHAEPAAASPLQLLYPLPEDPTELGALVLAAGEASVLSQPPSGHPCLVERPPARMAGWVELEYLGTRLGSPAMLIAAHGDVRCYINGRRAPSLAVVREKDEVLAPAVSPLVFYLSLYLVPYLGPLRPGDSGHTCPVCRSPIAPTTARIYVCPYCSRRLHAETADTKAEPLGCLGLVSACSGCNTQVMKYPGFSYVPVLS